VPASLIPTLAGLSGFAYAGVALVLGVALLGMALRFAATRSERSARWLFLGSITYLPLIWIVMMADKL
jgi:heme o synthase